MAVCATQQDTSSTYHDLISDNSSSPWLLFGFYILSCALRRKIFLLVASITSSCFSEILTFTLVSRRDRGVLPRGCLVAARSSSLSIVSVPCAKMWLCLGGLLVVALHPRILACVMCIVIKHLLRRCGSADERGRHVRHEKCNNRTARSRKGTITPTVLSVTIESVHLFRQSLSGVEIRGSDGSVAVIGKIFLVMTGRSTRQKRARRGHHRTIVQRKLVIVRMDGVMVSTYASRQQRQSEIFVPKRLAEGRAGHEEGRSFSDDQERGPGNTTISLPAAAVWCARLMALEIGDLRVELYAGKRGIEDEEAAAMRDRRRDSNASKLSSAAATHVPGTDSVEEECLRSMEAKEVRVVGSFSRASSCLSVSVHKKLVQCTSSPSDAPTRERENLRAYMTYEKEARDFIMSLPAHREGTNEHPVCEDSRLLYCAFTFVRPMSSY